MIKAIIFDLNGILIKGRKLSKRFMEDFGIEKDIFLPKLFEIMKEVRKPNARPAFSFWEPILKEWNLNLKENEFWDYWFKDEHPSESLISFIKSLKEKKDIKIFVLSNNFKERATFYGHYPWLHDVVDKVYFSWQTGFVKPDIRAWQLVLDENNLKGEECIYFDDQKKNIEAARNLGINSFLFTNEEDLKKIINNLV